MKNLYPLLAIALFSTASFGQVKKSGQTVVVKPQFNLHQTYHYEMSLKKIALDGEDSKEILAHTFPVELNLYGEGEGFYLFEWNSAPMLFFQNNEENTIYTFPTEPIRIKYRTDENYILGEVSNYDEVIQDYAAAYQQMYHDTETNYEDLASKSALYFIQMFHQFYGDTYNMKEKEQLTNLFFNPMKNAYSAAEDEISYMEFDEKPGFTFKQKYNTEMEDNSAKMMNHQTVDSYRSKQTGADYTLKAWGNQTFESNGLINQIERFVEVNQDGKVLQFIYKLQKK